MSRTLDAVLPSVVKEDTSYYSIGPVKPTTMVAESTMQRSGATSPPSAEPFFPDLLGAGRAVVIRSFLSAEECSRLIAMVENDSREDGVVQPGAFADSHSNHAYRRNLRMELESEALAKELHARMLPFLEPRTIVTLENCHLHHSGCLMIGEWRPAAMCPVFACSSTTPAAILARTTTESSCRIRTTAA